MKQLSIVIITFNEEKNIGRCLESINGLSDDIIVVDSGSTDLTLQICDDYEVKFHTRKFEDYSSQKNFANKLAKYDVILSIDADECLSSELKQSIINLELNDKNIAYSFNRLNHHCNKPIRHSGWYPDRKVRIWNSSFGQWQGTIHECLAFNNSPTIKHLNGDLLHYTYNSFEEHIKQAEKFSLLNAEQDFINSRKTNLVKTILKTHLRFLSIFFFKLGFLDGKYGFFIAIASAYATFLRNMELLKKRKNIKD